LTRVDGDLSRLEADLSHDREETAHRSASDTGTCFKSRTCVRRSDKLSALRGVPPPTPTSSVFGSFRMLHCICSNSSTPRLTASVTPGDHLHCQGRQVRPFFVRPKNLLRGLHRAIARQRLIIVWAE